MKLNTEEWKEFRVGDWFSYDRGKESAPNQNINGDTWIISETSENNGYVRKVVPTQVFNGNCLTVSVNFAQTVHYQPEPFCASVNIIIIRPLLERVSKSHLLFIASVLSKQHRIYSYSDKISKDLLMDELMLLPSKNGEPDWDFMEKYIKEIEEKYIEKVDEYNQENIQKALGVVRITEDELYEELVIEPADRYEEFKIEKLFDGLNGDFDIKQEHINNKGDIVITSGLENNGVLGKTDVDARVVSGKTLTVDMFGNVFYRPYAYKMVTHARVFALVPKFEMNDNIGLFMVTVLFYLRKKYSYSHMCSFNKIKKEKILLPAIDKETPDFEYMEKAIYIYTKKVIRSWQMDNEKEINALKAAISKGEVCINE